MSNIIRLMIALSCDDSHQSIGTKRLFDQFLASNNWSEEFNFLDTFEDEMYISFRDTTRSINGEDKSLLRALKEFTERFPWNDLENMQILLQGDQNVFRVDDCCKYCDVTSQFQFSRSEEVKRRFTRAHRAAYYRPYVLPSAYFSDSNVKRTFVVEGVLEE